MKRSCDQRGQALVLMIVCVSMCAAMCIAATQAGVALAGQARASGSADAVALAGVVGGARLAGEVAAQNNASISEFTTEGFQVHVRVVDNHSGQQGAATATRVRNQ